MTTAQRSSRSTCAVERAERVLLLLCAMGVAAALAAGFLHLVREAF